MDNQIKVKTLNLVDLTSYEVDSILKIIEILFKEELEGKSPVDSRVKWSLPFLELSSDKTPVNELKQIIIDSVDSENIKDAHDRIQKIYEQKVSNREKVVEDQPNQTTPDRVRLNTLESDLEKLNKETKDSQLKAKREVDETVSRAIKAREAKQSLSESIARQEKNLEELRGKVIYATVSFPETLVGPDTNQVISTLQSQLASTDRDGAISSVSSLIQDRVPEVFQGMDDEREKQLAARYYAATIIDRLENPPATIDQQPITQAVILDSLIDHPDQLDRLVSSQALETTTESLTTVFNERAGSIVSREVAAVILGDSVATKIFGPDITNISVSLSTTPSEGAIPVDLEKLTESAIATNKQQLQAITAATSSGGVAITSDFAYGRVGKLDEDQKKEGQIEQKRGDISPVIKDILSRSRPYGNLKFNSKALEFATKHIQGSDQLLYLFQSVTGISLGISLASKVVPLSFGTVPTTIKSIQAIKWAGAPFTYGTAIGKQVSVQIGGKIAGQTAGQAVGQASTQVAAKVATQTGFRALFATLGASLGNILPIIGTFLGALIGDWAAKHIDFAKIKKWLNENGPVLLGLFTGGFAMIGFGPLVGVGAGVLTFALTGGSVAALGAGFVGFFGNIGNLILISIGMPVIIFLLSIPPIVAFIMLIINSGAYIVPPSPLSSALSQDNPYMSVTKKAEPNKISNPSGKSMVTYTVTITATKGILSNVKVVSSECKVTKKNKTSISCPPENIPNIPSDLKINPGSPYSFTFNSEYDSKYSDSLVFDSIEISADAQEEQGVTTTGSATVCIGDCPNSCVNVEDSSWSSFTSGQNNLINAAARLVSDYPGFMDKVCAEGKQINICYTTSDPSPMGNGGICNGSYYARHIHTDKCDINFNQCGIKTETNSSFLLTHELTHHIQDISGGGGYLAKYVFTAYPETVIKGGFCSYSATIGSPEESQAEALGLFVSIPSWGTCATNYQSMYPLNYKYAQSFMAR